jgi:hypothetical protein
MGDERVPWRLPMRRRREWFADMSASLLRRNEERIDAEQIAADQTQALRRGDLF